MSVPLMPVTCVPPSAPATFCRLKLAGTGGSNKLEAAECRGIAVSDDRARVVDAQRLGECGIERIHDIRECNNPRARCRHPTSEVLAAPRAMACRFMVGLLQVEFGGSGHSRARRGGIHPFRTIPKVMSRWKPLPFYNCNGPDCGSVTGFAAPFNRSARLFRGEQLLRSFEVLLAQVTNDDGKQIVFQQRARRGYFATGSSSASGRPR